MHAHTVYMNRSSPIVYIKYIVYMYMYHNSPHIFACTSFLRTRVVAKNDAKFNPVVLHTIYQASYTQCFLQPGMCPGFLSGGKFWVKHVQELGVTCIPYTRLVPTYRPGISLGFECRVVFFMPQRENCTHKHAS